MATFAKRLQVCRMIFKAAIRAKYISTNPFQGVSAPATVLADKFFFVTREMTQRLLDACPDVNWRLFVALGRYGGFRVPSEACSLRWQDILWDQNKIVVQSPKGERYGKGERIIASVPGTAADPGRRLRASPEGDVYCIEKFRRFAVGKTGWMNCSLGSQVRQDHQAGWTDSLATAFSCSAGVQRNRACPGIPHPCRDGMAREHATDCHEALFDGHGKRLPKSDAKSDAIRDAKSDDVPNGRVS